MWQLINEKKGKQPCAYHNVQVFDSVYKDENWVRERIGTQNIRFICDLCHSERVYHFIKPETTKL